MVQQISDLLSSGKSTSRATLGLLGATGAIGRSVSSALAGAPYRVIGRDEAKLKTEFGALAEFATWNPDDPASVRNAFKGLSTIVYMLGVPYDQFALHPQIMKRVVEAAVAEGVQRILLIGTLYVFGRARTPRITEDHPREPHTFKGRMRKEQEDILMETSGLQATVLRLPDFYGPDVESSLLHDVFVGATEGRTANLLGPIDKPHEFVFVPDVGPVVARMLETPGVFGRGWNLGGAGTITGREVAEIAYGGKPRLRVANKFMLRLLGLFNPLMRELVEMNYLMTEPLIVDDRALTGPLGSIKKTSYRDGIAQCLAAARRKKKGS